MTLAEIRKKYVDFYTSRDHSEIPSSLLIPENDPTTLFTGSGMQPLLPYLLGQNHPSGNRLVNSQKCFRAEDIEEVGDNRHTTFFEMLGNWSLGDYFKKEQLPWFYDFLTKEVGLDPKRLYVTVFSGDEKNGIPADEEAVGIWKELFAKDGIDASDVYLYTEEQGGRDGMQGGRIFYFDAKKNWWSRAGVPEKMPTGEPGGPDSEVFFDFHPELGEQCLEEGWGDKCHPNCDCGRFMEIGNNVFMQYQKQEDGTFKELPQKNIDFGGGLERIVAAKNDNDDVFTIDVFVSLIKDIESHSGKTYAGNEEAFRVVADHLRGAVFMMSDGVFPTNTDAGYFVRRLVRRAVRYLNTLGVTENALRPLAESVIESYGDAYPSLKEKKADILTAVQEEESKFRETLEKGLRALERTVQKEGDLTQTEVSGPLLFTMFTTHGFPAELSIEELKRIHKERGVGTSFDEGVERAILTSFELEMKKHQELSRAGADQKFKGGLADNSEKTTALHTATHLMLAGLRKYVGDHVHQAGSNITEERTRFDFTNDAKVERDVLDKVEAYVNEAISKKCDVVIEQMEKEKAKAAGVEGSFWEKYPDVVNVYAVKCEDGTVYSQELCGGPHVKNTSEIKGTFRIKKEEASSRGVRRVKAVII